MSMTDPIADLLTRIRNAMNARHDTCIVPASRAKESVVKIMKENGFIANYVRQEATPQDNLVVFLKYTGKTRVPVIKKLRRVSKPGRRVYKGYRDVRPVLGGLGLAVLSTPKGILADKTARRERVGGEVLCEIW